MSMDLEAQGLLECLQAEEDGAPICPACVQCFLRYLRVAPGVKAANIRTLRANHHELLAAIMRFLTLERTGDWRVLAGVTQHATMTVCRNTSKPPSAKHKAAAENLAPRVVKDGVLVVVGLLFELLDACLRDAMTTSSTQTQVFSTDELWPRSLADLLPFGAKQSVSSLLDWFKLSSNAAVYSGFDRLVRICRADLQPELMVEDNRHLLVTALCSHLDAVVAELLRARRRYMSSGRPARAYSIKKGGNLTPHARGKALMHLIHSQCASRDRATARQEMAQLAMGFETKLRKSLENVESQLKDDVQRLSDLVPPHSSPGVWTEPVLTSWMRMNGWTIEMRDGRPVPCEPRNHWSESVTGDSEMKNS